MSLSQKLSIVVATASVAFTVSLVAQPSIPDQNKICGFAIGCQAYSFNRFTAFEAIDKTAQAGGKVIEFYPGQKLSKEDPGLTVDHNSPKVDEVVAKLKARCAEKGILPVNYGVVGIPRDEAGARKVFDFAKKMGLYGVTTESVDAIDTIEKLVKEYDICVGYHNHPGSFSNPNYKVWNPYFIAGLVAGRDKRIGSAADTGHWVRSNLNPVECLKVLKGRVVSCHLKDLNQMGGGAHDVPYGIGVSNIKGILNELKAQGFQGNISIEYEYNWDNSVPEITQCIDFVRDYCK